MTPTVEGDALTGHFRANKNIAPWGLSLHRRFSSRSLVRADERMGKEGEETSRFLS